MTRPRTWIQVGTVELLSARVYPSQDADEHGGLFAAMVAEPGTYPVYRSGDSFRWMMQGRVSVPEIGDTFFSIHRHDRPQGDPVEFSSPTYEKVEFAGLLADPVCQPGPTQQLRFVIEPLETH